MVTIVRKYPRLDGKVENPLQTVEGYKLADPTLGPERHHKKFAKYAPTLTAAAELIRQKRYSLWMKGDGIRETLISADKLEIID